MTTLIVHIDNKKSEKAIKAVLDALGVNYELKQPTDYPAHVVAGVRKSQEDVKEGRVKPYEGLHTLLTR